MHSFPFLSIPFHSIPFHSLALLSDNERVITCSSCASIDHLTHISFVFRHLSHSSTTLHGHQHQRQHQHQLTHSSFYRPGALITRATFLEPTAVTALRKKHGPRENAMGEVLHLMPSHLISCHVISCHLMPSHLISSYPKYTLLL